MDSWCICTAVKQVVFSALTLSLGRASDLYNLLQNPWWWFM